MLMLLGTLVACEAKPAPEPAAEPEPAPAAEPAPAPSGIPPAPEPSEFLAEHMKDHFGAALQARDAVIRGEQQGAYGALVWLAQRNYAGIVPAEWSESVKAMQAAAAVARDTDNLRVQAAAVANLAGRCADCHRARQARLELAAAGFEEELEPNPTEPLKARMHRHLWAAERMWEGLIADEPARYAVGAAVLADARPAAGADPKLAAQLQAVRELGTRAQQAATPQARANAYAEFLARCASCHTERAVKP